MKSYLKKIYSIISIYFENHLPDCITNFKKKNVYINKLEKTFDV